MKILMFVINFCLGVKSNWVVWRKLISVAWQIFLKIIWNNVWLRKSFLFSSCNWKNFFVLMCRFHNWPMFFGPVAQTVGCDGVGGRWCLQYLTLGLQRPWSSQHCSVPTWDYQLAFQLFVWKLSFSSWILEASRVSMPSSSLPYLMIIIHLMK